ncbi:MAG: helix-turn-helix transcriptional regulator [Candidatus Aminicenantes bacterium]|nr:MAG: helix-turn-helix transcriptional regulator [Candidatus Aminicenantes bacterium]
MIDEINKETIANRIKKIRKTLNIKGKDFAPRIKISGPSLSEIENGKYYPNFEFIYNIVHEFNVNLYYLFFGEGNMFIEPGKRSDMSILEELAGNIGEIRRFIYYFERSEIIRYFLLSQFKSKLMSDKELVEKELEEFERGPSGKEKY